MMLGFSFGQPFSWKGDLFQCMAVQQDETDVYTKIGNMAPIYQIYTAIGDEMFYYWKVVTYYAATL